MQQSLSSHRVMNRESKINVFVVVVVVVAVVFGFDDLPLNEAYEVLKPFQSPKFNMSYY